jgi:hypothetical protein
VGVFCDTFVWEYFVVLLQAEKKLMGLVALMLLFGSIL